MEKLGENKENLEVDGSEVEQIFPTWEEHQKELENSEAEPSQAVEELQDTVSKEEKLAQLKAQMVEMVGGEPEQIEEEKVKFGVVELPKSLLGEEKVLIDSVRGRSKLDFIGRAKDKKALSRIEEGVEEEEELKELFTPTVAKAFLDECHENPNMYSNRSYARLFEALPIEAQLEEFSKKEAVKLFVVSHESSETLMNKVACGMIENLEAEQDADKRINSSSLNNVMSHEKFQKIAFGGNPVSDLLTEDVAQRLFEASEKTGVDKFDRAVMFLKQEQIFDQLEDLTSRDMTVEKVNIVCDMMETVEEKDGVERSKWRSRYQVAFPAETRRLAEIDGRYYKDYTLDKAREITWELDSTLGVREKIGLSEANWDSLRRRQPIVYEQAKTKPIDEETAIALKLFTGSGLINVARGKLEALEDVKDVDNLFLATAKEKLGAGEFDEAREFIGQYAFGMGTEELAQDLVSLGVIEVKKRGDSFDSRFEFNKDKIKIKDLYAINGMSEERKLLVLDAVALLGCKDSELSKKLSTYEENHTSLKEKGGLVEILDRAKEEASEKVSETYSNFMQSKIEIGSREVAEFDYEGKQVPVLKMEGKEFLLLIHRLGAFSKKDRENPAQWNDISKSGKRSVGYISTSAIANGSIRLANIEEKHYSDEDEIFYAFSKLGKGSIKAMCEKDAHTDVDIKRRGYERVEGIATGEQDHFYMDPRELIAKNKRATMGEDSTYKHNEVVLDRYSGNPEQNGGRLQPNQVVVFTDDPAKIGDLPKKHAAYFGIPILMVDPNKYK